MIRAQKHGTRRSVLEAFDTLFNKRDYVARPASGHRTTCSTAPTSNPVARVCSTIKGMPPTFKHEHEQIVADGEFVIVHSRFSGFGQARTGLSRTSFVWSMDSWSAFGRGRQ